MNRTPEQIQNLKNLIRANRESPYRLKMICYSDCGTAHCVIGNYAQREDLQSYLRLDGAQLVYAQTNLNANYDDEEIQDHFGLYYEEVYKFFSPNHLLGDNISGCCRDPQQAADFIENYLGWKNEEISD